MTRVLICDDHRSVADALALVLERAGHDPPRRALRRARRHHPDAHADILNKLGVHRRAEAVAYAVRRSLVPVGPVRSAYRHDATAASAP